jgi:hypothetical protein
MGAGSGSAAAIDCCVGHQFGGRETEETSERKERMIKRTSENVVHTF